MRTGAVTLALLSAAAVAVPAGARSGQPAGPDKAFTTPIAHGARHRADLGLGLEALGRPLEALPPGRPQRRVRARRGRQPGALLPQGPASADPRLELEALHHRTALASFEPEGQLQTTAWSSTTSPTGSARVSYLRGGGDPTLSTAGLEQARRPGARRRRAPRWWARSHYDDSFLDHVTGIPQHGITPERVGRSLGSRSTAASPSDPAKTAAQRFDGRAAQGGHLDREQRHTRACRSRVRADRRLRLSDDGRPRPGDERSLQQLLRRDAAQGRRGGVRRRGLDGRRHLGGAAASPPSWAPGSTARTDRA